MKNVKSIVLKSFILLVSVPALYWLGFGITSIFVEPYHALPSDGMTFYKILIYYLGWFLVIIVPVIVIIHELLIKNEIISTLIHLSVFVFIVVVAVGGLPSRPFENALLLICIGSTILTRLLLDKIYN
jgi:hypothetical protein